MTRATINNSISAAVAIIGIAMIEIAIWLA